MFLPVRQLHTEVVGTRADVMQAFTSYASDDKAESQKLTVLPTMQNLADSTELLWGSLTNSSPVFFFQKHKPAAQRGHNSQEMKYVLEVQKEAFDMRLRLQRKSMHPSLQSVNERGDKGVGVRSFPVRVGNEKHL